jgi:hypothetical protein
MLLQFLGTTVMQFAVNRGRVLADCIKTKENLNFYVSSWLKWNYDGLKSMSGIQIRIRLSLDLFGRIQIFQGAMAVHGVISHACSQIGIRVVRKAAGSEIPDFTSMDALLNSL